MKIEHLAPASLKPYENNSRIHSKEQIKQICRSIKEFGFTNPILIDDTNVVIAGHARLQASEQIGLTQVPCIRLSDLSPEQTRAYVIADNKLAENAGWRLDNLQDELATLSNVDFDLSLLGFNDAELEKLLSESDDKGAQEDTADIDESLTFQIILECADENHQSELLVELQERKIKCRPLIS